MVAQCRRCGSVLITGARFCSSCGDTVPPDPDAVATREIVLVRPLVDPAVSGRGRTRELSTGAHPHLVAPRRGAGQAVTVGLAAVLFAGVGVVAFMGRHADRSLLGSESTPARHDLAAIPSEWELVMHGPAPGLETLCGDIEDAARRRVGVPVDEAFAFTCERDPTLDGLQTTRVAGGEWQQVHFVRTRVGDAKGRVRLATQTRLGWFLSDPVVSLSAGQGRNEATELQLDLDELAPSRGQELSVIAGHRFVDEHSVPGQRDELEQTFRVACALVSGVPECLRVRTRWRATKLAVDAKPASLDELRTVSAGVVADATRPGSTNNEARGTASDETDERSEQGGELELAFANGVVTVKATKRTSVAEQALVGEYRWQ